METIKNIFAWIIAVVIAFVFILLFSLNIYSQITMQEKIMAIPSDGNIETIGE